MGIHINHPTWGLCRLLSIHCTMGYPTKYAPVGLRKHWHKICLSTLATHPMVQDIEAKYYADQEDAYDMRKTLLGCEIDTKSISMRTSIKEQRAYSSKQRQQCVTEAPGIYEAHPGCPKFIDSLRHAVARSGCSTMPRCLPKFSLMNIHTHIYLYIHI